MLRRVNWRGSGVSGHRLSGSLSVKMVLYTSGSSGTQTISLDHLSSANVALIPSPALPTKARLTISVDAPSAYVARVRLQVRKTNGKLVWSKSVKAKQAGTAKLKWNLRDSKGRKVKKGK